MSTKSKRRSARRHHEEEVSQEQLILGELMGALLSAITFGALEEQGES